MNNNEEIRKQNIVEMPDFDSFMPTPIQTQNAAAQDIPQNIAPPVSDNQASVPAIDLQTMQSMFQQAMVNADAQNGANGDSNGHSEAAAAVAAAEKNLKRKSITLMASVFLLIALLIIGSIAWYTRISGITGMSLQAAKFDFKANYVKDNVIIDVWDYWGVNNQKAAPGTGGVIPILLSSDSTSETGVNYSVNLGFADMADKFKQRLRYFYFDNNNVLHPIQPAVSSEKNEGINGKLMAASQSGSANAEKFEYIYWEWLYEFSDDWFLWNNYWYHGGTNGGTTYNIDQIANSFENAEEKEEVWKNLRCAAGNDVSITGKQIFEVAFPTPEKFYRNGKQYSTAMSFGEITEAQFGKRDYDILTALGKTSITGNEYYNLLYPSASSQFCSVPLTSYRNIKNGVKIEMLNWDNSLDKAAFLNDEDVDKVAPGSTSGKMTGTDYFNYLYPNGQMTLANQIAAFDSFDTSVGLGSYNNEANLLKNGVPYKYVQGEVEDPNDPAKKVTVTAYQKAMIVKLSITGAQAKPILFQEDINQDEDSRYLGRYGVKKRDQKYAMGTTKYLNQSDVNAFSGTNITVDSTIGKHNTASGSGTQGGQQTE